jgi:membrane protease YdiL (CAAX protease family)
MPAQATAAHEPPPKGPILPRPRTRYFVGPLLCVAVLTCVEAALIAPGHVLAGDIVEAILLLALLQVAAGLSRGSAQSRAARAAILALMLVPLNRVVAMGLPLGEGSYPAGLLVIALLVGFAALTLAPKVGVIRGTLLRVRSPISHLQAVLAGLVLGLVAYLLGAPVLWSTGAHGDQVLLGVLAAGCAALVEELVFRGVIQLPMQRVAGRVGVIAAVALFTSTYLDAGSASLVLVLALAGAVFANTVARTGTLGGPMLGHLLLAVGAGAIWPALLGRAHPNWLSGPGSTIGLAVATASMTAILLYRPVVTVSARARGR